MELYLHPPYAVRESCAMSDRNLTLSDTRGCFNTLRFPRSYIMLCYIILYALFLYRAHRYSHRVTAPSWVVVPVSTGIVA